MDAFLLREPFSAWSHALWMALAIPGALLLWRRADGNRGRQLVLAAYTFCLGFCALASTLFHSVHATGRRLEFFLLLDHIGIYLLIAGTYTPIACTLMEGRWRRGTLAAVWLAAAVGAGLNVVFGDLTIWVTTTLYLALGWGALICYIELGRTLSQRALLPVTLGGVLYSVGAILHTVKWPVVWPGVVGPHELFHLFVVAASFSHYRFMFDVVAPWGRQFPDAPTPIPASFAPAATRALVRIGALFPRITLLETAATRLKSVPTARTQAGVSLSGQAARAE
jgi:hemolysin III